MDDVATAAMERITLHGGPADGMKAMWSGGDVMKVTRPHPVAFFGQQSPATNRPYTPEEFTYRRSMITRTIFVFQP